MNDNDILSEIKKMTDSLPIPNELSKDNMLKDFENDFEYAQRIQKAQKSRRFYKRICVIAAILAIFYGIKFSLPFLGGKTVIYKDNSFHPDCGLIECTYQGNGFYTLASINSFDPWVKARNKAQGLNETQAILELFSLSFWSSRCSCQKNYVGVHESKPTSIDYIGTELRTEGVLEGDITVTDGKYIYSVNSSGVDAPNENSINGSKKRDYDQIRILRTTGDYQGSAASIINIHDFIDIEGHIDIIELYILDNTLIALCETEYASALYAKDGTLYNKSKYSFIMFFDVTNPNDVVLKDKLTIDGSYETSRIYDGYLYLFTNYTSKIQKNMILPLINGEVLDTNNIYIGQFHETMYNYFSYTIMSSIDLKNTSDINNTLAVACTGYSSSDDYYVTKDGIYFYYYASSHVCTHLDQLYCDDDYGKTVIMKFDYNKGVFTPNAIQKVKGTINDTFCIDEYDGYLRVIVTDDYGNFSTGSTLYIFNNKFEIVSTLTDIAVGEATYSALFNENIAYIVTFDYRMRDPLFSIDLSDPTKPTILDALKIDGYSDYMKKWGNDRIIGFGYTNSNASRSKVSLFDSSDPYNLKELDTLFDPKDEKYKGIYYEIYSLENYKAKLINYEKNIIGFAYNVDRYGCYGIYSIVDDKFTLITEIYISNINMNDTRGIYIDGVIYIVTPEQPIHIYRMEDDVVDTTKH